MVGVFFIDLYDGDYHRSQAHPVLELERTEFPLSIFRRNKVSNDASAVEGKSKPESDSREVKFDSRKPNANRAPKDPEFDAEMAKIQARKKTVYLCPHQDDELLCFGVDACIKNARGEDVHIAICVDGSRSRTRKVLGNGKECPKHEGLHQYQLSIDEFIDCRDVEFQGSCQALGYRPSCIHFYPRRAVDSSLTEEEARQIARHYIEIFPDATICAPSPFSGSKQHVDHSALGRAVVDLMSEGVEEGQEIPNLLMFVEVYMVDEFKANNPGIKLAEERIQDDLKSNLLGAFDSYKTWDPSNKRFAIGYHSVTKEIDYLVESPISHAHRVRIVNGKPCPVSAE